LSALVTAPAGPVGGFMSKSQVRRAARARAAAAAL
jgi:hypothetical protein